MRSLSRRAKIWRKPTCQNLERASESRCDEMGGGLGGRNGFRIVSDRDQLRGVF